MKIELVAKTVPTIDGVGTDDFTAFIARIGKVKDNPEKLIKFLIKHAHWSPMEHTFFTFKIRTSRAIGRELLRHRSFTFQELSQRYEETLEFEPIEFRAQHETNRQSSTEVVDMTKLSLYSEYDACYVDAESAVEGILQRVRIMYEHLLKQGVARECARMILPECTSTTILMTGNIRSWIHFLAIRDDERAQKEAQLIAKEIKKILTQELPITFNHE